MAMTATGYIALVRCLPIYTTLTAIQRSVLDALARYSDETIVQAEQAGGSVFDDAPPDIDCSISVGRLSREARLSGARVNAAAAVLCQAGLVCRVGTYGYALNEAPLYAVCDGDAPRSLSPEIDYMEEYID